MDGIVIENPEEQDRKVIVLYVSRYQDDDSAEKFARFVDSYKKHPAGHDHDLFIIKKGFQEHEETWNTWTQQLDGIPFQVRAYPDRHFVLGYVRNLMEEFPDCYILVCNATNEILVDNWLSLFMKHANPNRILGSMYHYIRQSDFPPPLTLKNFLRSSRATRRNWWLQLWGRDVSACGSYSRRNHPLILYLRLTGFMVPPYLLERILHWPRSKDIVEKEDEIFFECSKFSLTTLALLAGLEPIVVSSDGRAYTIEEWPSSGTYIAMRSLPTEWKGKFENLIIGDHRSQEYESLSLEEQKEYVSIRNLEAEEINRLLEQIRSTGTSEITSVFPEFQPKSK